MPAQDDAARAAAQQRTALVSVAAAGVLVTLKLVTGLLSGSLGLLAEAVHSGTDLVAALLTFLAIRVSGRPPDAEHPYGHGKAEHLAALGEAGFLGLVSVLIGAQAVMRLVSGDPGDVDAAWWALAVLGLVVTIDATRATVSWRTARRYGSPALVSNALHFASDLLGSLAVLAGLLVTRAGAPEADAAAALFVAVLVVLAAVRLMRQNVDVLMDRSPPAAEARARAAIAAAEPGIALRRLRVREAAGRCFVDVVVGIHADAAMGQGHAVADSVEAAVRDALPRSDVVVHVEPDATAAGLRERASGAALTVRGVREVHNVAVAVVGGRRELSLHLKLPPDLRLADAHATADRVEAAILHAVPEIADVHTHIEPLAAGEDVAEEAGADLGGGAEAAIDEIVRRRTGRAPRAVRLRRDARGVVALVTVALPADAGLGDAHAAASAIRREIREEAPGVVDAVIHTEPAG
jgi:cation diffusion facilitator family transporter